MKKTVENLIGKTFSRLVVLASANKRGTSSYWKCKCQCGTVKEVLGYHLKYGKTKSCGCLKREKTIERNHTHRMTGSAEYRTYGHMIGRCHCPTDESYPRYGGRGIIVCESWRQDFMNFFNDLGPRPSNDHTLERIDFNGPYSPENCRWAHKSEQSRNRSNNIFVNLRGKKMCLAECIEQLGISRTRFRYLYERKKLTIEQIQSLPECKKY